MNKKFTFMVAALLAAGAWTSAHATLNEVPANKVVAGAYLIGTDADLTDDKFDLLLDAATSQGNNNAGVISSYDKAWFLEGNAEEGYKIKTSEGNYLSCKTNTTSANLELKAASTTDYKEVVFEVEGNKLKVKNYTDFGANTTITDASGTGLYLKFENGSTSTLDATGTDNIIFAKYIDTKPATLASNTLNSGYYVLVVGEQVLSYNNDSKQFVTEVYNPTSEAQLWTVDCSESKITNTAKLVNKVGGVLNNGSAVATIPVTVNGDKFEVANNAPIAVTNYGSSVTINLYQATPYGISAQSLNNVNSGSFVLNYEFDKDNKATVNAFANKELRAFEFNGNLYFATAWPTEYNAYTKSTIEDQDDFNKFTFLVAKSASDLGLSGLQRTGESAEFVEVKGSSLSTNSSADLVQDLKSGKHAISNAQFVVESVAGTTGYTLSLPYFQTLNSSKNGIVSNNGLKVVLVKNESNRIVTTALASSLLEMEYADVATIANKRTVAVKDFLKADKASIFNIKFLSQTVANSSWSSNDKATKSECNKYLGINASGLFAQGSEFVNLNAPENQWIVIDADKNSNIITFQNRELNTVSFKAELTSTSESNVYELKNVTSAQLNYAYVNTSGVYTVVNSTSGDVKALTSLEGTKVQLTAVTPVAEAGYATTELDNAGLVRFSFESRANNLIASKLFVVTKDNATDDDKDKVVVEKEESNAAQFSVVKFDAASTSTSVADSLYASNTYAYWATDKVDYKYDADSIAVVTYAFKQLRADGQNYYLSANMQTVEKQDDVTKAPRFIVKINKNGSYSLIDATGDSYVRDAVTASMTTNTVDATTAELTATTSIYYDYSSARAFDMNILKETPGVSYTHKPQHVTMEAVNGGYVAMNAENGEGIVAPVSTLKAEYTKEDLTFWLDTLDSEAVTPSFMISKAGKYMYNAVDSLDAYNDATASAEKAEEFGIKVNGSEKAKAIFQSADLTKVEDIENYKFQIVQSADEADEYIIKSLNDYKYVAAHNQKLYFTDRAVDALKLVITPAEAPTSNEGVSATEVKVVAQDGSVVVKNAAGKNVVVSTILGQVVANEVLTSDNATINVPAGIVVVAVEGESFKVNVK